MDIIEFREFCLSLPHTTEEIPFNETTLVYKVAGKMFTMADMVDFVSVAAKCDPDRAVELREHYPEVTAAYHMNKKHWNSVGVTGDLPDKIIREWVRDSYDLVVKGLPKRIKEELGFCL